MAERNNKEVQNNKEEVPFAHYEALFRDLDPDEAAARCGVPFERGAFTVTLLGEAVGMLGFLFTADDALVVEDDARGALKETAAQVLDAATEALSALPEDGFTTQAVQDALQAALVDGLGIKPRFAFTPLRVAVSGRRVSPPLFESLEILGRASTLARLAALRASL